jgi:hypothetical protein
MPFKSQAQRRKFAQMMVEGKISPQTFEEWSRETGSAKLPERVGAKRAKKTSAKKSTARKGAKKTSARKTAKKKTTARKGAKKKTAAKKRA